MDLVDFEIVDNFPFQSYLLSDTSVKRICKDFTFYNIKFYKKEKAKDFTVCLQYPKGNMYWFLEFVKSIKKDILDKDGPYLTEWYKLLNAIKKEIKNVYDKHLKELEDIKPKDVVSMMNKYSLRDYQAFDLLQLLIKMKFNEINAGLILSEQRTGKTRVSLATALELSPEKQSTNCIVVCPKGAVDGWQQEIAELQFYLSRNIMCNYIKSVKSIEKQPKYDISDYVNFKIITYDTLKRLSKPQQKELIEITEADNVILIGDECHKLRNFKTLQSEAVFDLEEIILKYKKKINLLGIIGVTGTPAVKDSYDVFGSLSFVNFSKISLSHTQKDFNEFKEYFYHCEDTSYGKVCKSLKRKSELNYIINLNSVQTKQKDLDMFKNYKKVYKKVELEMDANQHYIYNEIKETFEYEDLVDCKNSLAKTVRLRQVCNDPSTIIDTYKEIAPKLKYVVQFAIKNSIKFIVFSKMLGTLLHLKELFDKKCIKSVMINGSMDVKTRTNNIKAFKENPEIQVIIIQQDAGREALTLPEATATIFLDRDFAQGFNEQAEARMTPVDGSICTKYIIDIVMKNTIEDEFYNILVVRKESINNVNVIYDKILEIKKKEEN